MFEPGAGATGDYESSEGLRVVIINRKRLLEFTTLVAILHPSWLITPDALDEPSERKNLNDQKNYLKTFNLRKKTYEIRVGVLFGQQNVIL